MEAATAGEPRRFDHLREHSIGLWHVLFQSITHMAPAAAVAYSIYISVPDAQQALPLSVALALIACICAATAIGQLAKLWPSAGGMYTYVARSLGPGWGFLVAWLFIGFEVVGTEREVGRKFGRWLDVVVLQRLVGEASEDERGDGPHDA